MLIVFKILEYAEIGGMAAKDCGLILESLSTCLSAVCENEQDETALGGLIVQIQTILNATTWETDSNS